MLSEKSLKSVMNRSVIYHLNTQLNKSKERRPKQSVMTWLAIWFVVQSMYIQYVQYVCACVCVCVCVCVCLCVCVCVCVCMCGVCVPCFFVFVFHVRGCVLKCQNAVLY